MKILKTILAIAVAFPMLAGAQAFNQSQIANPKSPGVFGGIPYSSSTATTSKLFYSGPGTSGMVPYVNPLGNLEFVATSSLGFGSGGSSQWITNGSDIYYSLGNVGIGSSTPQYPLTVQGTSTIYGPLELRNTAGTGIQVVVGNITGNARGTLGIDIQSSRNLATQVAAGSGAVTIGSSNLASSTNSVVIGSSNMATSGPSMQRGDNAIVIGGGNTVGNGIGNVAIGNGNTVTSGFATGDGYGTAIGRNNNLTGAAYRGTAVGYQNTVNAATGVVLGNLLTNNTANSVQIGTSEASKIILLNNGNLAVGGANTAPGSRLTVSSVNSATQIPLFTIASSSSAVATSTYLSVSALGTLALNGAATTTAATGFDISSGCYAVSGVCVGTGNGTVNTGTTGQVPYYAANGTTLTATSSIFISSDQNVGVGTVSPSQKLHVTGGNLLVNRTGNTNGNIFIGDGPAFDYPGIWFGANATSPTYSNYSFLWEPSIGTLFNSPTGLRTVFRVANTGIGAIDNNGLALGNGDNGAGFGTRLYTKSNDNLSSSWAAYFANSSGDALLNVRGDGNVGIGTTSPGTKLGVSGTVLAANFVGTTTATSTLGGGIDIASGCYAVAGTCLSSGASLTGTNGQIFRFTGTNVGSGTSSLVMIDNGNVGIASTTPGVKLAVGGTVHANNYIATSTTMSRIRGDLGIGGGLAGTYGLTVGPTFGLQAISQLGLQGSAAIEGSLFIGTTTPNFYTEDLYVVRSGANGGAFSSFMNSNPGTSAIYDLSVKNGTSPADGFRITVTGTGNTVSTGATQPDGAGIGASVNLSGGLGIYSYTNMRFYSGGQSDAFERIRLDSTGKLGIGTTSPGFLVDLFSTATTSLRVDSNSTTRGSCLTLKDSDGVGYTYMTVNNGVATFSTTNCN